LRQFLDRFDLSAEERNRRIAGLFAGIPLEIFQRCAREIPLMPGAVETIVGLRKAGFRVGIVSDSFDTATEVVRRRVFADFSFANLMSFRNGLATGRVTLAPVMSHPQGCKLHAHCKANVMAHLLEYMAIGPEAVLAVGDGENDVCMLRQAGCSVAFQPSTPRVREAARHMLRGTLAGVLALVQQHLSPRLEPLAALTHVPDPSCP
jgi:HAD superfamily phosphoserine phosphatase-like hydrolase